MDFIADTGDGGNPTYAVARALAAPALTVPLPAGVRGAPRPPPEPAAAAAGTAAAAAPPPPQQQLRAAAAASGAKPPPRGGGAAGANGDNAEPKAAAQQQHQQQQPPRPPRHWVALPRADVLLIGGDLAYPNPCRETYEQRLFRPFQDALPPPAHYHPGRLVVHKPDLPPGGARRNGGAFDGVAFGGGGAFGAAGGGARGASPRGASPRAGRRAGADALAAYRGPGCFAIPGNHDWIDGLETFTKQIQHKGWLGGWLLPQVPRAG